MQGNYRLTRPVVLVGPMGSGKSTVGKALSEFLQLSFLDLDEKIVQDNGMSIPEIFRLYQEDGFRQRETAALRSALQCSSAVIASGGGITGREENRRLLDDKACTVYLYCEVETQYERTLHDNNRPMIYAADRKQRLADLFAVRHPLYQSVQDITVDSGRLGVDECVRAIVQQLKEQNILC